MRSIAHEKVAFENCGTIETFKGSISVWLKIAILIGMHASTFSGYPTFVGMSYCLARTKAFIVIVEMTPINHIDHPVLAISSFRTNFPATFQTHLSAGTIFWLLTSSLVAHTSSYSRFPTRRNTHWSKKKKYYFIPNY